MESFEIEGHELRAALRECGLFDSLDEEQFDEFADAFDGVRLVTGDVLMREGEPADALYIVRHGRLRASVAAADGGTSTVGEVGKHQVVGEMAVITDHPRAATVHAMRDTDLFRFPAEAFGTLIQRHPEMLRPFASVVVERLRHALSQPPRPALPATVVILMLCEGDATAFARRLASGLTPYRTAIVTPDDARDRSGEPGWLLDIENDVDVSILVADAEPTEWTRRCLRHADHVEMIVDGATPVSTGPIRADAECAQRLDDVPVHLVMLHAPGSRPTTGRWLNQRPFASYANLRKGDPTEIDRLARLITGRARVLVLGGGGARGFAHFGVAQAFQERGIVVDGIIGTSAGAVAGGLLARMPDAFEAADAMLGWFESVRWRRDFTPPNLALTTGRLMTEALTRLGDGLDIEQLPIGFAAISCDLVSAEPFVHDRGPLWQAIRASGSVPGLFPPVLVGDRLLADGGLVANMPSEIARSRHPNATLIAVDVGDPAGIVTGGVNAEGVVSGWQRLRQTTRNDTVTLARLLMRLTELGRNDSTEAADVTIRPDVSGFGITDTKHARRIIRSGYEAGQRAADDLESSNS